MLGVLGALGALSALRPVGAHDPITTKVTFDREIRAILQAHCVTCHARGGPAPMPLTTYDEVRPWARAVKDQVLTRRMPKWSAAHGYGAFTNDPSLTPAEMAIIAAWVDGGQPMGSTATPAAAPVASASRKNSIPLVIAASATGATLRTTSRWIGGWQFEPGDPLITSATFVSADGTPVGTWVAGDPPVVFAVNAGMRIASPIRVTIARRRPADYEKPMGAKPSVLRLMARQAAAERRVWIEQGTCGAPRTGRAAGLLAIRPLLADGASARVWLERPGAPQVIVGWFRTVETAYRRTYWLARPAELPLESRVQADAPCTIELTLSSR